VIDWVAADRPVWVGIAVAIIGPGVVTIINALPHGIPLFPGVMYTLAVVVAALVGGSLSAVLAAGLSSVGLWWMSTPRMTWAPTDGKWAAIVVFPIVSLGIAALVRALERSRREAIAMQTRTERNARIRVAAAELFDTDLDESAFFEQLTHLAVSDLADLCYLYLVDHERRLALAHVDPSIEQLLRDLEEQDPLTLDDPAPAAHVARTGETVYVQHVSPESRRTVPTSDIRRELSARIEATSMIIVPVRDRERILGSLAMFRTTASAEVFDPADIRIVNELAQRIAHVLERRALLAERTRAQARLALLAKLGELASTELDVEARIKLLPDVLLPAMGDACWVYVREREVNALRVAAMGHVDTRLLAAMGDPREWPLFQLDEELPSTRAVRTGNPQLIVRYDAPLPPNTVPSRRRDEARRAIPGSLLTVPLSSRGVVFGALSLGYRRGGRLFSAEDVPLAQEIARRVVPLLEHAQRFERERRTAEVLQASLLPDGPPVVPGHDVAVHYRPSSHDATVGGDWYDVVRRTGSEVVLIVGDVAGHGIPAAAAMGRVATAARILARDVDGPGALVERLGDYVRTEERVMVTMCVAFLDVVTGALRYQCAGHPPPVLAVRGQTIELTGASGPPLGVTGAPPANAAEATLPAGGMLLLYTDGLVERRGASIDEGIDALHKAVIDAPTGSAAEIVNHVLDQVLGDRHARDDVAVVAVRSQAQPAVLELQVPLDPKELAGLRLRLARWLFAHNVGKDTIGSLVLAASEAAANVIVHAYGIKEGELSVRGTCEDGAVTIEVRDHGKWRPAGPNPDGRGLALMRLLVRDVDIETDEGGTTVRLRELIRADQVAV
jgi:serine phosphatase RsbU (regulator of sigma subunit)/anti-sigma regulatory factor (Ser/Thr protein kinase)